MENGSETPDFLLANFLAAVLYDYGLFAKAMHEAAGDKKKEQIAMTYFKNNAMGAATVCLAERDKLFPIRYADRRF